MIKDLEIKEGQKLKNYVPGFGIAQGEVVAIDYDTELISIQYKDIQKNQKIGFDKVKRLLRKNSIKQTENVKEPLET